MAINCLDKRYGSPFNEFLSKVWGSVKVKSILESKAGKW